MGFASRSRGMFEIALWVLALVSAAPAKYSGGTGEPNDPYQIATAADLIALGETPEDYDKHFILTADIDLDPNLPGRKVFDKAVIAPDTDPNDKHSEFQGTPFTGVFDGNGHTISHLTVTGDNYYSGLFGCLASGAEVKDLGLVDVNIAGSGCSVGAMAGYNGGAVTHCHATGMVCGWSHVGGLVGSNKGIVTQCHSAGTVIGSDGVAGLVGGNGGSVDQCYSTAMVAANSLGAGGLVGSNEEVGSVVNSYSSGAVTGGDFLGGLVGVSGGSLTHCYSTGAVSGTGSISSSIGGLVGVDMPWISPSPATINHCFWDMETSGLTVSGGGAGKTTSDLYRAATFNGWGEDGVWTIDEGRDYPRLAWQHAPGDVLSNYRYGGGSGTPDDPYQICTPEQLNAIGTEPGDWNKHFRLMADIDLSTFAPDSYSVIGEFIWAWVFQVGSVAFSNPFTGVFDGAGHTITGFRCIFPNRECIGLFGLVDGSNAQIRNLRLSDPNVRGDAKVGAVIGWLKGGNIDNCSVDGGKVSGGEYIGGLIGSNGDFYSKGGTVTGCYTTGTVSGSRWYVGGLMGTNYGTVRCCLSNAQVDGYSVVGGLVGSNGASIAQSHSSGAVSGIDHAVGGLLGSNEGGVNECYSIGEVLAGGCYVGGLIGLDYWNSAADCFWDIETSGQTTSAGGTGKTTAEMQTASTFLDAWWDFAGETRNGTKDIWWINEGKDYPRLWWEAGDAASQF